MSKGTELAVKDTNIYLAATAVESEFLSKEEMEEQMKGVTVTLPRVKIPAGGGLSFEIPNGENPDDPTIMKVIEGVIIDQFSLNVLWEEGSENDPDAKPLCTSNPGADFGVGEPGGKCVVCPLNVFGSGAGGKGKMCKNTRRLFILLPGEMLPLQLTLPPTSLKNFNTFLLNITSKGLPVWAFPTKIGLKKEEGAYVYSVATFARGEVFPEDDLRAIKAMVGQLRLYTRPQDEVGF